MIGESSPVHSLQLTCRPGLLGCAIANVKPESNDAQYQDCSVAFVATGGDSYHAEVAKAAASCRRHMPDVPMTLFTDRAPAPGLFDRVEMIQGPGQGYIDKAALLDQITAGRVLFLDTDTYVTAPLYEVFELLNRFEVAGAHAPWRLARDRRTHAAARIPGIPDAFAEINTGVLGFRNSPEVRRLCARWR